MIKNFCILGLALVLIACGDSKKEIDGFKDVKFGMTSDQLVMIGAKDYNNLKSECSSVSKRCAVKTDGRTLFGKPVNYIYAEMRNGSVLDINVNADLTPREFIALADKEFGSAKAYRYKSFVGNSIEVRFWPMGGTTSLSIKFQEKDLDGSRSTGIFGNIEEVKSVDVVYQGKLSTATDFENYNKSGTIKPKDY